MASRRWCFTINNYSEDHEQACYDFYAGHCKYLVAGRERGEQGTPHLQGFLILKKPQRLSFLRTNLCNTAHYEVARGSSVQASDYSKKDNAYDEYGEIPNEQGRRTDIEQFKEWVTEQPSKPSQRTIAREFPSLFLRYPRLCELVDHLRDQPSLVQPGQQLREWQLNLSNSLEEEPDDRKIHFIIDPAGGKGKSWFVRYMVSLKPDDVQFLSVGKRDDLALAIDESKSIFLFDIPRSGMEHFQYSVLEKLKDQLIFSGKYASRVKVLPNPVHVVVLANEEPDYEAMTSDRYNVIQI